ncbi:beta-1,6-N-acetylglucosaminyltransferase [Palleronia caenipelagi]|uniref:Peptide O-xylosyltransferase n=1 Tax=Palleronia caenipelagi TaxID=2489174 RepID=A0A547Q8C5_9RHOB|nr:beta-1,6-N-acetylglucosaminyltransferase [Palleronia caenipelagi]TRD22635.1 beta-1,6-N-acetylglucosaminyltransferase [Palleronia caenipelagi]
MRLGIVMLCHSALDRAAQVVRHWSDNGCPVVIHVDRKVPEDVYARFVDKIGDLPDVAVCDRIQCNWGDWSLVEATQLAASELLGTFPNLDYVLLTSGTCLPLRPVPELTTYLEDHRGVNFIESVTCEEVPWIQGGLGHERFTLRFPFSWKRTKRLFDAFVALQRRVGYKRKIPSGLVPHMGSQWWCLVREDLEAILNHHRRAEFDRYFKGVWIPDESYFQTLIRQVSDRIESRSLTLAKFDFQGRPHLFYDDHLELLRRSKCFLVRKVWPQADKLYDTFLSGDNTSWGDDEPEPGRIARICSSALERRVRGRPGLYMVGRFPRNDSEFIRTSARYAVFEGFGDLFENFPGWIERRTGFRCHGHLFAPERAEFADGAKLVSGALSDNAKLRDYNATGFLTNLLWNTRGRRQAFLYGPRDTKGVGGFIASDVNADVVVLTGAWAVRLFCENLPFAEARRRAAELQQREADHLKELRQSWARARVQVWSLADFLRNPSDNLDNIINDISPAPSRSVLQLPPMVDLRGFRQFLQNLKNEGMDPYLVGDLPPSQELRASNPAMP